MRLQLITGLIIFLISAALCSQSNSIVIESEFKASGLCSTDSTGNKITYYIRPDILRVDIRGSYSNSSIIFQPSSLKIWVLFHTERMYYTMTAEELDSLETVVRGRSAEFDSVIQKMDEKARANMESTWTDGNPFVFEDPEYVLERKKDSLISQLLCDKYVGKMQRDHWRILHSNNLKTTGVKDEELRLLTVFSDFMGKGVKALSGNMDFCAIKRLPHGGYPILMENFKDKTLCSKFWLSSIYRKQLKNDFFQLPGDYGKFENPLGNYE